MEQYKDLDGRHTVQAFEMGAESIAVQFNDGSVYLYNYSKPGKDYVEHMKRLALAGKGLNSFITEMVKGAFAEKVR